MGRAEAARHARGGIKQTAGTFTVQCQVTSGASSSVGSWTVAITGGTSGLGLAVAQGLEVPPALFGVVMEGAVVDGQPGLVVFPGNEGPDGQVEGLADLVEAETEAQRRQAQNIAGGALSRECEAIRRSLKEEPP